MLSSAIGLGFMGVNLREKMKDVGWLVEVAKYVCCRCLWLHAHNKIFASNGIIFCIGGNVGQQWWNRTYHNLAFFVCCMFDHYRLTWPTVKNIPMKAMYCGNSTYIISSLLYDHYYCTEQCRNSCAVSILHIAWNQCFSHICDHCVPHIALA